MIVKKATLLPLNELKRDFPYLSDLMSRQVYSVFLDMYENKQHNISFDASNKYFMKECVLKLRRMIKKYHLPFVIFTNKYQRKTVGYEIWRFL